MKKKLLLLLLALAVVGLGAIAAWRSMPPKQDSHQLRLFGNVEIRDALLAFNEQQIVAEILVEEGDAVKAGQILARLRAQKISAQLAEAKAQYRAQDEILRRLENGARPQEVNQARAEMDAAQVQVKNARTNWQRLEKTTGAGASSRQALDNARALFEVEQAQLDVKRQTLALIQAGPREEEILAAKAQLDANRFRVVFLEERRADTVLKAPNDGIIQSRILEPGEMAGPTRPVLILAKTDPKWIRAYVPEPNLGLIRAGMTATVFSDTWPTKGFKGQIGFISSVAEFTPQAVETTDLRTKLVYEVRIQVKDPDNHLRLGMPVSVAIENPTSGN